MKSFKQLLREELESRGYNVLSTKKEIEMSLGRFFNREDYIIIDSETMPTYVAAAHKPEYKTIQVLIYTNGNISKFDMQKTAERIESITELPRFYELDIHVY